PDGVRRGGGSVRRSAGTTGVARRSADGAATGGRRGGRWGAASVAVWARGRGGRPGAAAAWGRAVSFAPASERRPCETRLRRARRADGAAVVAAAQQARAGPLLQARAARRVLPPASFAPRARARRPGGGDHQSVAPARRSWALPGWLHHRRAASSRLR